MKPPPHVVIVLPPFVRLGSLDGSARERLASCGFSVERDSAGFDAVRFADTSSDLLGNADFVETFRLLSGAGLAFGEDFKQGWAPADIMRELQSRERITVPFTAIAWRGPDHWFTTIYDRPTKDA
ncbi:MAG: hypothetical protein ACO1TE_11875 [Prosthecobacter sp.]